MLVEIGLESESFIAPRTLIVLEGRVSLHVSAQVGSVGERFAAMRTTVGLLARVRSHMPLQQPGSGKGLVANVTLMLEVVGKDVH